MSQGVPAMWIGTISLVRGVILRSRSAGSIERLSSTSHRTGIAFWWTTDATVATQRNAGRITSQPGPISKADMAAISAPVPLLRAKACFTP